MKKIKFLVVAVVVGTTINLTSCSGEDIAKKLNSCAQVAALTTQYTQAGIAYTKNPSKETCTAYRAIADQYVVALQGCSTVAKGVLAAAEDVRKKLDCSKQQEDNTAK